MSEKAPRKTKEEGTDSKLTKNLGKTLNEIPVKNSQIRQLMDENASLKKQISSRRGASRRRQSRSGSNISGLQGLQGLGSSVEMPSGYKKRGR